MERRTCDFVEKKGNIDAIERFRYIQRDDSRAAMRFSVLYTIGDLRDERKECGDCRAIPTEAVLMFGRLKSVVESRK